MTNAQRIEKLARTLSVDDLELGAARLLFHYGAIKNPSDPGWAVKLLAESVIGCFADMFEAAQQVKAAGDTDTRAQGN
ncbi:MAG: hypothetical protein WA864_29455 [Acetobacteraceae bacterium]